jgi:hypothetical protein
MKIHFVAPLLTLCAASVLSFRAAANPVLPYQEPIAMQLTNDVNAGGDTQAFEQGLNIYHRTSRSAHGDIHILRDLNELLADEANYPALLADAAAAYLAEFKNRRDTLEALLRAAPLGHRRNQARRRLDRVDSALSAAEDASTTSARISHLHTAAVRIVTATHAVQRARRATIHLSSMHARIGALKFRSSAGYITGGPRFDSETGTTIGAFDSSNGVLTISAIDRGRVHRGIQLHVEGISTNTPATYPLGVGENTATYDATDLRGSRRREYRFQCNPTLTNGLVTNSFLTIEFIGNQYLIGRFAFNATNSHPRTLGSTNTTVTVRRGVFQLNYRR